MRLRIAENKDFSKNVVDFLNIYFEVDINSCTQDDIKSILEEYDIFWFRLGYRIDEKVLSKNSRCKIIATPVTGIDHIDIKLCEKLGIKIISLKGETEFLNNIRATAELTINLTMSLMRKTNFAIGHVLQGNWNRDFFRGYELYKKKVGIVGLGRLGTIVSEYFKSFGCEVYYNDTEKKHKSNDIKFISDLGSLISECDIISIHVDYNKSTHNLFNKQIFKFFNDTKWLINTSRGQVIDEDDLINCLESKNIAGVALDVINNENKNIMLNNPLLKYSNTNNNLIISPHIGGNTYESFKKTEMFIAKKIINFISS